MKHIFILFIFLPFIAKTQVDSSVYIMLEYESQKQNYILNPNPKDTLCISEIERAKKDIAKGEIAFSHSVGFLYGHERYEKELRKLCKEYGLVFKIELISDDVFEDETQGCYGYYMDKVLSDKFGVNFKKQMHLKADSLFLANTISSNKTIIYWDCDERPRLPNEKERFDDYLTTIKVSNINIEENKEEYGGWPFFDLGFIVEKDSTISGFYIGNFVPELEKNKQYKNKLFELAVSYIKENYPVWIPGKINREIVRTDNNVRIFFRKE